MLGIFLLYFIAKPFYQLAEEKDKNKWLFAVLSIIAYYAGSFTGGIIIAIVSEFIFKYPVDKIENILLGIMALPFGLLFVWLLYRFLTKKWNSDTEYTDSDILDENIKI